MFLKSFIRASFVLPAVAGALYGFGFAGYDVWPCAFLAFAPLFAAIEWRQLSTPRQAFARGFVTGFIANLMCYYWLIGMLRNFSGFPFIVCVGITLVLCAYQGGLTGLFALGWRWARSRALHPVVAAMTVWAVVEWAYPILFENYLANALHNLPHAIQVADLGGPILVSALIVAVCAQLFHVVRERLLHQRWALRSSASVLGVWAAVLGYGAYRIDEVERRASKAPHAMVGAVQANMGIFSKRDDPKEGLHRHIEDSLALERSVHPDLIVWPESAYTYFIPENVQNIRRFVTGPLQTPVLFGGLAVRNHEGDEKHYNTAFIADKNGQLHGSYDKTFLLAFGEYLPLGEWFPILYELSPHTGRFTAGSHVRALPFDKDGRQYRIATLICYEDILPSFVRGMVRKNQPHLFANLTNDAWFGDTLEPWIHLALAKFRSVEHHRAMVRATNSGVSAMIDPVGRVLVHTGVMTREQVSHSLPLLQGHTVYEFAGSWPVPVAAFILMFAALRFRRNARARTHRAGGSRDANRGSRANRAD